VKKAEQQNAFRTPKSGLTGIVTSIHPYNCEEDWEADNEYGMELDNGMQDPESSAPQDVSAATYVP
jgi:hypothetical protein